MEILKKTYNGIAQYDKNVIIKLDALGVEQQTAIIDLDNGNIKKRIITSGYAPITFKIPNEFLEEGEKIKAYISNDEELIGIINIPITKRPNPNLFTYDGEPILKNLAINFTTGDDILKTLYKGNFKNNIEILTKSPLTAKMYVVVTKDEKYNQFAELVPERIYLLNTNNIESLEDVNFTFKVLGDSGEENGNFDNSKKGQNCFIKYNYKEILRSTKTNTTWADLKIKPVYPESWLVLEPGVKIEDFLKTFKGA